MGGSEVEEEALEEDSGVDSAEDSVEVEGEVRMEAETEVMMEELLEEVSEAVVKVAEEAEDSEEGRVGAVVVKEEAGEVIAVPLKAKAKRKVFSRLAASKPPLSTSPSHFYQKFHPSGACSRPPPLLSFEPSFEQSLPVQNVQHLPRHQNSKLAPISRVCLTSKIHNRYLSPTRYFQGFSIKFRHRHRSQIIPRHIGHQRPPRKMIPDVPLHHRLEHAFQ